MSGYEFCVNKDGKDLIVLCDAHFGPDTNDGGFDICIDHIYEDVDFGTPYGKDLEDEYDHDELLEHICSNEDLGALAYEEACDHAEYLRDMRRDEEMGI